MKTITVEDFTWKTLSEMKLQKGLPSLDAVIAQLIIIGCAKVKKK
jgi:predicted CopG family antitoxin